MKIDNNISAFILCGGKSSRMQTEKGLVIFRDKPFIQHIIDAVKPITSNISLVTENTDYEQFGFPLISDIYRDKGPVGGIFSALKNTSTSDNLILSCDIPLITIAILSDLISSHAQTEKSITIASEVEKSHPLIGVYHESVAPFFEKSILNDELKLMSLITKIGYNALQIKNTEALQNINDQNQLKQLKPAL
ncbi:molybdenum cofactor guanylyltransferase [Leeuwenhoekiella sp. A16]|uniref:molybdenum cofactor guanylyltransferase n=1 Tax=unclassified Leeuwenhoekiella TaxID=2615029 RepID=UPI003A7F910E